MLSTTGKKAAVRDIERLSKALANRQAEGKDLDTTGLMNAAIAIIFRCVILAGGQTIIKAFHVFHEEVQLAIAKEQSKEP